MRRAPFVKAVLAVLAQQGIFTMAHSFAEASNRAGFDDEIGWAADSATGST